MIKARAFIFDIGGTLLDTRGRFRLVLNKTFKEWGIKPLSWEELRECYPNGGIDKLVLEKSGKKEKAKRKKQPSSTTPSRSQRTATVSGPLT